MFIIFILPGLVRIVHGCYVGQEIFPRSYLAVVIQFNQLFMVWKKMPEIEGTSLKESHAKE